MLTKLRQELYSQCNAEKADHAKRFFKTGIGEYGENDEFLGIVVPVLRNLSKKHKMLSLDETLTLLKSKYHEERQLALFILVLKFQQANSKPEQKLIYEKYIEHFKYINNWDLVDCSAHYIVGSYLKAKSNLESWAQSPDLWTRRIAMISTFYDIKNNEFQTALKIATILVNDTHDLIHKAVGWMLREIGNRNLAIEEKFLKEHSASMPRTMLRYAIEKFPEEKRKAYLTSRALL